MNYAQMGRFSCLRSTNEPKWSDQFQIKLRQNQDTFLHIFLFDEKRINKTTRKTEYLRQVSEFAKIHHHSYQRNHKDNPSDWVDQQVSDEIHNYYMIDSIVRVDIRHELEKRKFSNGIITLPMIDRRARIKILVERFDSFTSSNDYLYLHLRALGLKNVERSLFTGLSDPFLEVWKEHVGYGASYVANSQLYNDNLYAEEETEYSLCYRSNIVKNHVNPTWEPFEINLNVFNGDIDRRLKLAVFDWEESGGHRLLGEGFTSPKELRGKKCMKGNGDLHKAIKIIANEKRQGSIIVLDVKG
eukprot:CAMPEP_0116049954 /NCGR_PEP_ID=MMETSP0322-20121206/102_1 /TAXON_ID=163516 /ORGANISM="Leptocylindrus danicus var. apora, Strain B651" /LENGTH=299 /DNA_ID=CAMNT_0003532431 /DNA_START=129 /DNA_END=1028 /DNA_ORIENTATION=-